MDHQDLTTRPSAQRLIVCAAVFLAPLLVYVLRLNDVAGQMVDDGYYVMLARALADGEGYRLVSSATTTEMVPLYPPAFPALLSFVFRISHDFPQNVWLLKSVSIVAMLAVGLLTNSYLRRREVPRELAASGAVAVMLTPAFVFLATSTVMSECVFTLCQLAALLLIQRSVEEQSVRRGPMLTIAAAALVAANVLVRSAGIGLALAIGLWLLKERLWRRAALFGAVIAVCVIPWMLYARAHAPTPAEQAVHGGSIVYSYGEQIWMRWAGDPASGTVTLRDIPARVGVNVVDVFARGMGGIFLPALLRGPAESGEEMVALGGAAGLGQGSMGGAPLTMVISLTLSACVLVGFVRTCRRRATATEFLLPIALGIIIVWPFWTFRFLVPLTPYLLFYLLTGVRTLASASAARIAVLCVIGLHVSDHTRYVLEARDAEGSSRVTWLVQGRETDDVLRWIVEQAGPGAIATTNPGLVYLRTGHKTLSFDRPLEDWSIWKARGVRYVVCLLAVELPRSSQSDFRLRYRTPSGFWIIEL